MIKAHEEAYLEAHRKLDEMLAMSHRSAAAGRAIHEVEEDMYRRLLEMGRFSLEGFVQEQGTGDLGATLDHGGLTLNRLEELHARRYVSIFGELWIERTVYGKRETQKHEIIPLDARLTLPESDFSYLLQNWDQRLCVQNSHAKSKETIQEIFGLGQSVRSLEHMNVSMAEDVRSFWESQPTPPPKEEGSILVFTADGKGVPMRRDDAEEPTASGGRRRRKGEKANKKREACVGAVYTIEPFRRTHRSVVDDIMREIRSADRPEPQQKQLRAELTRELNGEEVKGKALIFSWFEEQAETRNPHGKKPIVLITDGDLALQRLGSESLPEATIILDVFHMMERLWDISYCFYREGSDEAQQFVTEKLEGMLGGEVGRVIGGMRQMATKRALGGSRRRKFEIAIRYLEKNRAYMNYKAYLAKGFPIGSGVVEGACRHLVKDRMELTGMRWRVRGAQAMLDLRAVFINGDWEEFQDHRIDEHQRNLYPYRSLVQSKWRKAA